MFAAAVLLGLVNVCVNVACAVPVVEPVIVPGVVTFHVNVLAILGLTAIAVVGPLQTDGVVFVNTGFGFTVTVTAVALPTQEPNTVAVGVTE